MENPESTENKGITCMNCASISEGPSTQYLRFLAPEAIKDMVFGTLNIGTWTFWEC